MTVGREPLQPGLRERSICVGGEEFTVVELEKTTDLVDDWIQNQMATEDPFGVVLWPAAQCIATNLLHDPPAGGAGGTGPVDSLDWLNGRRVVELGAGTGLCSLVAARAGAKVLTTDTNTLTLDLVALAARRQELEVETGVFDITGTDKLPALDVLIGADCMYNKAVARALARRCIEAHTAGARVLVGDSVNIARDYFVQELEERSQVFSTTYVDLSFTGSAVGADQDVTRGVSVALFHLE